MVQLHNTILTASILLLSIPYSWSFPQPVPNSQFVLQQNSEIDKDFWAKLGPDFENAHHYSVPQNGNSGNSQDHQQLNLGGSTPTRNEYQNIYGNIPKKRKYRNSKNSIKKDKELPEFQHPYPKYTKGEVIVHRPKPIVIKQKPTKILIKHEEIRVCPPPVVFHRSPQAIKPIIIHNERPQRPAPALRIQPVFVNVDKKKHRSHAHYISDGGSAEHYSHQPRGKDIYFGGEPSNLEQISSHKPIYDHNPSPSEHIYGCSGRGCRNNRRRFNDYYYY